VLNFVALKERSQVWDRACYGPRPWPLARGGDSGLDLKGSRHIQGKGKLKKNKSFYFVTFAKYIFSCYDLWNWNTVYLGDQISLGYLILGVPGHQSRFLLSYTKLKIYCTFGHKMHLYSVGLSRWTISLVRVPPEQQARDKNKAKGKNL
jgi:hypothetical protein